MKWRFEKKFNITNIPHWQIKQYIKLSPMGFKEIHHPRFINSIYLDTFDFRNYKENLLGIAKRIKYRVRWYGEKQLFQDQLNSILEIKIKKGLIGKKEKYQLSHNNAQTLHDMFKKSNLCSILKSNLNAQDPVVLIKYFRKYYLSGDGQYTLTFDKNISFKDVRNNNHYKEWQSNFSVLELKYDQDVSSPLTLGFDLPFRQSRFSKYVHSIDFIKSYSS